MNLPREPGLRRRLAYSEYLRNGTYTDAPEFVVTRITEESINIGSINFGSVYSQPKCGLSISNLLKCSKLKEGDDIFCPICQDSKTNILRELSCKHVFHANCIDYWFVEQSKCPLCMTSF